MVRVALFVLVFLMVAGVAAEEKTVAQAERRGEEIRRRWPKEIPIDATALRNSGVRRLDGKHLILYTDLPADPEVDRLPDLFDQSIPRMADYFGLDPKNYENFRLEGFLIDDFEKFERSGAVRQVPKLRNGYALRCRIWLRNQSSGYYRRHLLLHEGVHALMGYAFGVWGPPWYREGTAELLATHRWENGRLTLAAYPASAKYVPRWGRIEYVREAFQVNGTRTPKEIFELGPEDYNENEAYAWSWAFAAFCEGHSRYREAFRRTAWGLDDRPSRVADRFLDLLVEQFPEQSGPEVYRRFENDWFDFLANIGYDYDFKRTVIGYFGPETSIPGRVDVQADRGWQRSGFRLERGTTYRITATGRFQLGDKPDIWWSEPNGITLRYHRGAPLGMLLATLLPDTGGFSETKRIGSKIEWTPEVSGTLYFRINDSPAELNDNRGAATVDIKAL